MTNPEEKDAFVSALQSVIDTENVKRAIFDERQWVIKKFHEADLNKDGNHIPLQKQKITYLIVYSYTVRFESK